MVEQSSICLFDCPPILYSPPPSNEGEEVEKRHFDLPTSYVRSHEQDSVIGTDIKRISSRLNVFYKIFKMSKQERQKLKEVSILRDKNEIIDKNM